jgi:hypothetical protein
MSPRLEVRRRCLALDPADRNRAVSAVFAEAKTDSQPSDGMMLVYLVELDGGATDEETVDPGAFPPTRT